MSKEQILFLEEIFKRDLSTFQAVLMTAQEARFINDQVRLDITKATDKPATMALKRLFEGRVVEDEEPKVEG